MLEKDIKRIVLKLFPEIASGLHLPTFGRVHSISDPTESPELSDAVRPFYAANVEVVNDDGEPDERYPIYKDVPLPVPGAGMERGDYEFPEPGAFVELAFANGMPSRPFVRTVLGLGWSLPKVAAMDKVQRATPGAGFSLGGNGDINLETFADAVITANRILETSQHKSIEADTISQKVNSHSTEEITGEKLIEAMSFIGLLSGGSFNIGALESLNLTAAGDVNQAGHSVHVRAGNLFDVLSKVKASVQVEDGGKVWLGSQSINVLQVLLDLIQLVGELAQLSASHTHPNVAAPLNAGDFTATKDSADSLKDNLEPIVPTSE